MRQAARVGVAAAFVVLAGCGQSAEERRAETLAQDKTITPGIYGNVTINEESGDPGGFEIALPQGSDTRSAEFAMCIGDCFSFTVSPRRGLGGISFALQPFPNSSEQLYALRPDAGGIKLLISGGGLQDEEIRLERIDAAVGIAIAKGQADGS